MKRDAQKQSGIEKSFTHSDKHTLGDLRLKAWTPERIIAAQDLGMIQPNLGKEGWAQWKRTQLYPGAVKDTIIFVYLSTLDDELLDSATYEEARKMGIKRGLHKSDSKTFWEAYTKFLEVLNEQHAATTKPKATDEDDDDPKD